MSGQSWEKISGPSREDMNVISHRRIWSVHPSKNVISYQRTRSDMGEHDHLGENMIDYGRTD